VDAKRDPALSLSPFLSQADEIKEYGGEGEGEVLPLRFGSISSGLALPNREGECFCLVEL
jgi:hypothetical protein